MLFRSSCCRPIPGDHVIAHFSTSRGIVIHQLGAKVQGLPSCNGWDFWHVKNKLKTTLLDEVRSDYRNKKIN